MKLLKDKKILIMLLVALLGIAYIAAGATYAYLNANDLKANEFTIGYNDVELKEDFTSPIDINPGDKIKKKVWVENIGNTDAYVRVKILFSDSDMKNNCEDLELGDDWSYNTNDDYYYYTKKLSAGDKTSNLIEFVKIKSRIDEEELKSFDIIVYVESKTSNASSSYSDAWNL